MIQHYNIKIIGRVHGVGFRAYTQQMAEQLNIKGFVENQPDGAVYIEAEGENGPMQSFLDWCRQGPSGATVYDISITEGDLQSFIDFQIIY